MEIMHLRKIFMKNWNISTNRDWISIEVDPLVFLGYWLLSTFGDAHATGVSATVWKRSLVVSFILFTSKGKCWFHTQVLINVETSHLYRNVFIRALSCPSYLSFKIWFNKITFFVCLFFRVEIFYVRVKLTISANLLQASLGCNERYIFFRDFHPVGSSRQNSELR